jgi:hypothetical protein
MKIDGLDWMEWLHKKREESENESKRRGISGAEWLKEIRARAEAYMKEREPGLRRSPATSRQRSSDGSGPNRAVAPNPARTLDINPSANILSGNDRV